MQFYMGHTKSQLSRTVCPVESGALKGHAALEVGWTGRLILLPGSTASSLTNLPNAQTMHFASIQERMPMAKSMAKPSRAKADENNQKTS